MNTIRMFTVVFCVIFAGFDLVADVGVASQPSADEKERIAEEQSAILDTIAQINHINWVWNAAKTYNNSIVLAEEYDKISPGNLNFNRIPDEEILKRGLLVLLSGSVRIYERIFLDLPECIFAEPEVQIGYHQNIWVLFGSSGCIVRYLRRGFFYQVFLPFQAVTLFYFFPQP